MTQAKTIRQRVILLTTNSSQSIIVESVEGKINNIGYTAYGEQSAQQDVATALGFNGQLREARLGWYLPGNGYRAYNTRLMRFHSPDSWSPFGRGGLNAYMYCVGDPVNRVDPTGHWGVISLLSATRELGAIGYLTSSVGTGLNIGSLLFNRGRATLANGLGTLSGVTGVAAGLSSMFDIAPQASQLLSTTSLVSGAASTYLGYRSMRANFRHLGWYEAPFSRPPGSPPAYFELYPQTGASTVKPLSPPVYPLNRSTLLPAGDVLPVYSRQDPNLFERPSPKTDNHRMLSSFPQPIGVNGAPPPRHQVRVRREALDRMDGLPPAQAIRQRR
ncbi:RHS repeat-associated core domain-containing protein [Pseudomonas moorei]|uniref:RHS repeat-associated core domain-containing protein n=1 Tax=Pseudomonas moorei TaxID=395599 RepID=UPI00200DBF40|nr:RHS repeat-associated core domain-containing protein [Pseudomonas moorei]